MRQNRKNIVLVSIIIVIIVCLLLSYSLLYKIEGNKKTNIIPDTITAVTISSSTTFFDYKGTYMGFQYELFDSFCKKINRPYKIKVLNNYNELLDYLNYGKADICITPMAKDKEINSNYNFVGVKNLSSINLVCKKNKEVSSIKQLIGDTIVVPSNTIYEKRLKEIDRQLGGGICIKLVDQDSLSTEDLIRLVHMGRIDYTVSDEYLSKLSSTYYNDIVVSIEIGFEREQYWIVPKRMTLLTEAVNKWAKDVDYRNKLNSIYKKYFERNKGFDNSNNDLDEISSFKLNGKLSKFDDIFKKESQRLGFDWTVLAAIAWQESRFNPSVIGWSGARGLMGIMPSTGRIYKVSKEELLEPKTSITVAVDCLMDTKRYLGVKHNDRNNIAIVLAGYNAGVGHIMDAKRLAKKFNYDPDIWYNNLEKCVTLKSNPKYYNDPVCKAGYLRSEETIDYVNNVLDRYSYYNTIVNKR